MRSLFPIVAAFLLAQAANGLSVRGRVLGERGEPVEGASVQVTEMVFSERQPHKAAPRTFTGPAGEFILDRVPESSSTLLLLDVCVPGRALLRFGLKDLPEPIEIAVPAEGRLAGQVIGPDGKPFAGVPVVVQEDIGSLAPSPCPTGSSRQTVFTDDEGRFALEHLSPGQYSFAAQEKGYTSGFGIWMVEPGPGDGGPTLRLLRELPPELTSLEDGSLE